MCWFSEMTVNIERSKERKSDYLAHQVRPDEWAYSSISLTQTVRPQREEPSVTNDPTRTFFQLKTNQETN